MTGNNGYSASSYVSGTGFVDGHDSTYTFGSYSVVDDSGSSQAIDVYSGGTTAYFGDLADRTRTSFGDDHGDDRGRHLGTVLGRLRRA